MMKPSIRLLYFIFVCGLALALAACGGGATPAPATSAPIVPTTAVPPTEAAAATQPPPAVTTAEPTTAPTAAPTETLAPTPTPTNTPLPTPTPQPQASGACSLPYYPVQNGLTRVYQTSGTQPTGLITETVTSVQADSFILQQQLSPLTLNLQWRCTPDGLVAEQFSSPQMANGSFKMDTTRVQGVTLPPANKWQVGQSWQSNYNVNGTITMPNATGTATGVITSTDQIVGQESVTVPAGTYQALRIDSKLAEVLTVSVANLPQPLPVTVSFEMSTWYAQGIGVVKRVSTIESTTNVEELAAFSK